VRDNGGQISNKLAREVPALAEEQRVADVAAAIQAAFQPPKREDGA